MAQWLIFHCLGDAIEFTVFPNFLFNNFLIFLIFYNF